MAPDRGGDGALDAYEDEDEDTLARRQSRSITEEPIGQEPTAAFLRHRSDQPQFTLRALLLGLLIGILIAFSNTYFGLQTGWISGMAMPSALIGFAYFKGLRALMCRLGDGFKRWGWGEGFSEVENVLVQTVAGSVGTMPLGCGFVGVVPALQFLLKRDEILDDSSRGLGSAQVVQLADERGGLDLSLGHLILWALGLCFFGVVFAVPLRKEVIVREKLRFPSGTATALMIGVLHGGEKTGAEGQTEEQWARERGGRPRSSIDDEESRALIANMSARSSAENPRHSTDIQERECGRETDDPMKRDWKKQIRLLTYSFFVSGIYVRATYLSHSHRSNPLMQRLIDACLILHPAAP